MSKPMPRKRKEALKAKAKMMRDAKRLKRGETAVEEATSSVTMDESFVLPAPTECFDDSSNASSEADSETDEDFDGTISDEERSSIYADWIDQLEQEDIKIMAMLMYDNYRERFGLLKTSAAKEVALCLGYSEKTVRRWRKDFLVGSRRFTVDGRGKYARNRVINDEEYHDLALKWIHENAYVKGKPNMTAADFCTWVNDTLLPKVSEHHPSVPSKISVRTGVRWLHSLGFEKVSSKKGIYIDGHERQDVVDYRKLYLRKHEILASTHAPPPPCSDEPPAEPSTQKKLVLIFHDESTFHSNDDQGWMWGEKDKIIIKPKGQGRGIMVSDFIEEHYGFLRLSEHEFMQGKVKYPDLQQEARVLLKYGADHEGYWNSEKFLNQLRAAIKIAKVKYSPEEYSVYWFFDHSSGHTAFPEDALNASRMNVKPGGKQPVMHDTVYYGKPQKMVLPDGTPKGMKLVLQERGIDVSKMKADDMRKALQDMHDFMYEKTKLESLLLENNYKGFLYLNFTVSSIQSRGFGLTVKNSHEHTVTTLSMAWRPR